MRLDERVAVVTGGGRGIGAAAAHALARKGRRLLLVSRTEAELQGVRERIRASGGVAEIAVADVADAHSVDQLARRAHEVYGRVDILVNAAGVLGPVGPAWQVDSTEWVRTLHVNLVGTFLCCRAFLPEMMQRRWGRVVNFSGGGATSPLPGFSAYGASKAAVVRLSEILAEEVKEYDIQVNAVAPGLVDTRMQDGVLAAGDRAGGQFRRIQALRSTGAGGASAELAAALVDFLVSQQSAGLTGKLIAAPYDGWQQWDAARIHEIMAGPWFTLRRIDPHTLQAVVTRQE